MSDTVLVAVIAAAAVVATQLVTLVLGIRNSRKVDAVSRGVEEVRHATNSMKDRLVALTAVEAHAQGVKDERRRAEAHDEAHDAGVQEGRESREEPPA